MFEGIGNPVPNVFSVCVCVHERERERERIKERESLSCGLKCIDMVG